MDLGYILRQLEIAQIKLHLQPRRTRFPHLVDTLWTLVTVGHEDLRDGQRLEQKRAPRRIECPPHSSRRAGVAQAAAPEVEIPCCQLNPANTAVQSKPTIIVSENNPRASDDWELLVV